MTFISNCCGAEMYGMWEDSEICPDCQEHCGLEEVKEEIESHCGLKVEKKLVDNYWKVRENKPLDDKVSFKDIKPIKSII
jgi:hypothetical protein